MSISRETFARESQLKECAARELAHKSTKKVLISLEPTLQRLNI